MNNLIFLDISVFSGSPTISWTSIVRWFAVFCGVGETDWHVGENNIISVKALKKMIVCCPCRISSLEAVRAWEDLLYLTWKSMSCSYFCGLHDMNSLCKAQIKKIYIYILQILQMYRNKGLTAQMQYSPLLCVMVINIKQAKYLLVLFFQWKISVHMGNNHRSLKFLLVANSAELQ